MVPSILRSRGIVRAVSKHRWLHVVCALFSLFVFELIYHETLFADENIKQPVLQRPDAVSENGLSKVEVNVHAVAAGMGEQVSAQAEQMVSIRDREVYSKSGQAEHEATRNEAISLHERARNLIEQHKLLLQETRSNSKRVLNYF